MKRMWVFLFYSEAFAQSVDPLVPIIDQQDNQKEQIALHGRIVIQGLAGNQGMIGTAKDQVLLKVSIVNATCGELQEEVKYLKAASQVALFMQGLHFLALVLYVVTIAVISCRKRVVKICAKIEEEQVKLLEKRLQERKLKGNLQQSHPL